MSHFEMLCSNCMIPVAPHPGGPVGVLVCPSCHTEVQVPVLLAEDGETLVSLTDQLAIAERQIEDLRHELVESKRILEQTNRRGDDRSALVARQQLRINELNVERAELLGQIEQLKRQAGRADPLKPNAISPSSKTAHPSAAALQLQQLQSELAAARESVARGEAAQEEALAKLAELERGLSATQAELSEKRAAAERLDAELAVAVGDVERLRAEKAALRLESLQLRSQIEALRLEGDHHARSGQSAGSNTPSVEVEELKAAIAALRFELLNARELAANRESELIELKGVVERAERAAERAKANVADTEKQHERAVDELIELKRNYAMLNQRYQGAVSETKRLQAELDFLLASREPAPDPAPATPQAEPDSVPNEGVEPERSGLMKVFGVLRRSK